MLYLIYGNTQDAMDRSEEIAFAQGCTGDITTYWFGWKDLKYDSKKHSEYAEDLLNAPICEVLGSVVFFYQLFNNWIKNTPIVYALNTNRKHHNANSSKRI